MGYIILIAWLYVVGLISLLQPTVFRGIVTFVGTGLIPLAVVLFLLGGPQRLRQRLAKQKEDAKSRLPGAPEAPESADQPDEKKAEIDR